MTKIHVRLSMKKQAGLWALLALCLHALLNYLRRLPYDLGHGIVDLCCFDNLPLFLCGHLVTLLCSTSATAICEVADRRLGLPTSSSQISPGGGFYFVVLVVRCLPVWRSDALHARPVQLTAPKFDGPARLPFGWG